MQTKLRDKRLYWRGSVIWARVPGAAGRKVRRATGCTDEAAAVARANEFEREASDPRYAAAAATTISGAINALLDDLRRRKRSAATLKKIEGKLGHFIRHWGADLPMLRVTAKLVLEYVDKRQREFVVDHTIYLELGALRQVLRVAIHLGTFPSTVAQTLPPYFGSGHKPRDRWATPDELRALLAQFDKRRAAHLLYIVATGGRRSEVAVARRSDTDRARNVVHLHGTKTDLADDDVPITRVSAPLLERALADAPGKDALFHPWGNIVRDMKAACIRAGIPKLSPNDLRRTFGKWHRLAGVDVTTVSKMLRHTTDKLAQTTYAKVSGEETGSLVALQLEAGNTRFRGVLDLYHSTGETTSNAAPSDDESSEKQAPPPVFETGTFALGKRKENPRSVGNKKAYERKRATAGVPVLYASDTGTLNPPESAANVGESSNSGDGWVAGGTSAVDRLLAACPPPDRALDLARFARDAAWDAAEQAVRRELIARRRYLPQFVGAVRA